MKKILAIVVFIFVVVMLSFAYNADVTNNQARAARQVPSGNNDLNKQADVSFTCLDGYKFLVVMSRSNSVVTVTQMWERGEVEAGLQRHLIPARPMQCK